MIEVKRKNLEEIYSIMDQIQLNKITDANVRKLVLKLVLEGKKKANTMKEDVEEIRKKFFNGFENEDLEVFQKGLTEMSELFRETKIKEALDKDAELSNKYPEITEAYKGFNQALIDLQDELVPINTEKVNMDAFIDAMVGQDIEINGKTLDVLSPIFNDESEN